MNSSRRRALQLSSGVATLCGTVEGVGFVGKAVFYNELFLYGYLLSATFLRIGDLAA